jgi:RNA polymerase sigma factor (sigma-70 family)
MTISHPVESPPRSDETLLRGFAEGDANASLAFVRRFEGRVFGLASGMLGDHGLAEDVAQEAFVRAWRHANSYDASRGSVTSWLLRITHNLAIDSLRRRRPQPVDTEMIASLVESNPAASVEATAVTSHVAAQAQAAVARLPPAQATALLLAALYGYTAQQIASSQQVPLGTVKTRIRRGLRTLRAQLSNPDNIEPADQPVRSTTTPARTHATSRAEPTAAASWTPASPTLTVPPTS